MKLLSMCKYQSGVCAGYNNGVCVGGSGYSQGGTVYIIPQEGRQTRFPNICHLNHHDKFQLPVIS